MRDRSVKFDLQSFNLHLPGVVIGLYFLSLHFRSSIDLSFLVLVAGFFLLIATQSVLHYREIFRPATAFAAILFLSTMLSSAVNELDFVGQAMAIALIPGALVFLIVVLFFRERLQFSSIAWSFFFALCVCVCKFFISSYYGGFERSGALIVLAAHPLFLAPNDVLMFAIVMPLVMWHGKQLKTNLKYLLIIFYPIMLFVLSLLLLSRIALLASAVALVLPVVAEKRWRVLVVSALAGLALMPALAIHDAALLGKIYVHNMDRIRLWIISWYMFMDSPWLGHGPGSFSALYDDYLNNHRLAMNFGPDWRHMGWAHNFFLESAAEKGVLGLAAAVSYFVYLFSVIAKKLQYDMDGFNKALGLTVLLLLLAACMELSLLRVWAIYVVYLVLGLVAVKPSVCDLSMRMTTPAPIKS